MPDHTGPPRTAPSPLAPPSPPATPAPPEPAAGPSVLYPEPPPVADRGSASAPACFGDLNLDQVITAITAGRDAYGLRPFFHAPLTDVDAVAFRHEVFLDLEDEPLRTALEAFARTLRHMREHLEQAGTLRDVHQQRRLHLDAAHGYCAGVTRLAAALRANAPRSRGLRLIARYLAALVASSAFDALQAEAARLVRELDDLSYLMTFTADRVSVALVEDQADQDAAVARTFARFGPPPREQRAKRPVSLAMDRIEAAILARVTLLYPELFAALEAFRERYAEFLDPTVAAFDREAQFYLAYREYMQGFERAGLGFCYPTVSATDKTLEVVGAFDPALARSLLVDDARPVCNDVALRGEERIFVVTGANQGGKTTFARLFGQLHFLAALGCPVPARTATLFLADQVLTHFEQEEDARALRGKLQDELLRVRALLERASGRSVVIMNEAFSSTTTDDALLLSRKVLERLLALGVLGVWVTFIDELAAQGDAIVSLVALVDPDDPTRRTFELARRPADGRAHAVAIARAHQLTYEELRRVLGA